MNGTVHALPNGITHGAVDAVDVIIVGAGISGINAAYRVQNQAPKGTTFAILEERFKIGGTWDLFKYPGIRSDSDLYTFGFPWKPWTNGPAIAEAPLILSYIDEAVKETGIDKHIKFGHKVIAANWESGEAVWRLHVEVNGQRREIKGRFMVLGTGYYDYDEPLEAVIPGLDRFQGQTIHPQFWPEDLDATDKQVVIIGSGATAVTILPNIAKTAKQTTLVQRSPSYIFSLPNRVDPLTKFLRWLSPSLAYKVDRVRFLFIGYFFFYFCRTFPRAARTVIRTVTSRQLPSNIPHDPHFEPSYNPWEQRLCLSPDGDFYQPMRRGKASIVTGHIKTITERSVVMENGQEVPADIIITATGLKLRLAGGMAISIDGRPYDIPTKYMWKGLMLQDLPNAAFVIGYTNASWTLGADATAQTVTRLLNAMKKKGAKAVVPRVAESEKMTATPVLNLNSTYIQRALHCLPKTGDSGPWRPRTNYFWDISEAKWGSIEDGLEYIRNGGGERKARI